MPKKRIGYIDIAKCIAIIFIVVGHCGLVFSHAQFAGGQPDVVTRFAFSFHLPVFFLVSGYFFPMTRDFSAGFLKKDARALLLPYALTCVLIIIACTLTAHLRGLGAQDEFTRWTVASFWGAGSVSSVALLPAERIGGIWFLLAMFWAHLLIVSTSKLPEWSRFVILCIAASGAVLSARYVWLPWSIQTGAGCAIYLYSGMLARKYDIFKRGAIAPALLFVFAIVWIVEVVLGGRASVAMCYYPLGAFDLVAGIVAAILVVLASREIDDRFQSASRFMQWVGRNTLPIFCLHIMEDNVLNWGLIGQNISVLLGASPFTWIVVIVLRLALIAALVGLAYVLPVIRNVYFPQLRKRIQG